MNQILEPPRLLLDDSADPLVRQLLHSTRSDGPNSERLLLAPVAIAAMLGTQTLAHAAAASAVVASAKGPLVSAAASATAASTVAANGITTGATSAGVGVAAASASVSTATSIGAAASASVTSGLAVLPALAKSLLIGLAVGGAIVATVPDKAPLRRDASPMAVQSGEQVRATSLTATRDFDGLAPAVSERAMPESSPVSPSIEAISVNVGSRESNAHVKPEPRRSTTHAMREDSTVGLTDRPRDETSSLALAPPDISREVALLDAARLALGRNQPARAIAELEHYESLSRRTLDPEATVLRVRALLATGRTQEAEGLARAFSLRAPNAPQSQLLRKLTGLRDFIDPN